MSDVEFGAVGEGWGNLTLTFNYDGIPPNQALVTVDRDEEVCGRTPMLNESLIVNSENLGIKNIVVMLYVKRRDDPPPIHESYAGVADATIDLTNQGCVFVPHIVVLRVGQTLRLRNSDTVGHNTKCDAVENQRFDSGVIPPGEEVLISSLSQPETQPVPIGCNIHTWMSGRLVVQDHPYVGVSDENGKVVIENLPAGTFQFVIWHEMSRKVTSAIQDETPVTWRRGRAVFTIVADDENDQGTFSIAASVFERR